MQVKKIKDIKPGFDENSGPHEVIRLGIVVGDGIYIDLGTYYFGAGAIGEHTRILAQKEKFADTCVELFNCYNNNDV